MPDQPIIAAVISPERKVHENITFALEGNADIDTIWRVFEYPDSPTLTEIRKASLCVVFLDFSDPIRAKAVAAELDNSYPMATMVAVHAGGPALNLIDLMQLGIREVISLPATSAEVARALTRVLRKVKMRSPDEDGGGNLYAFLPAKPGVGATTLAAHGAAAAARLTGQRTLLLDFDFRLGMTSFLFKLEGGHSVVDAIALRVQLDAALWDQMVCRRGMLDILGSAPVEFGGINPETDAVALADFARQSYQTVCVDLPGDMRAYEIETLSRVKECFLVTTPDIGALHMAKRKAEILQSVGIHNKVSVIVNRVEGRGCMSIRDMESVLQLPVRFSVPAAEKQIAQATHAGRALEGRSPLVTQIENIARRFSPGAAAGIGAKPRKFIEMFSVSPLRDRGKWGWG